MHAASPVAFHTQNAMSIAPIVNTALGCASAIATTDAANTATMRTRLDAEASRSNREMNRYAAAGIIENDAKFAYSGPKMRNPQGNAVNAGATNAPKATAPGCFASMTRMRRNMLAG